MEQFSQSLVSITCSHDDETTLELEEEKKGKTEPDDSLNSDKAQREKFEKQISKNNLI